MKAGKATSSIMLKECEMKKLIIKMFFLFAYGVSTFSFALSSKSTIYTSSPCSLKKDNELTCSLFDDSFLGVLAAETCPSDKLNRMGCPSLKMEKVTLPSLIKANAYRVKIESGNPWCVYFTGDFRLHSELALLDGKKSSLMIIPDSGLHISTKKKSALSVCNSQANTKTDSENEFTLFVGTRKDVVNLAKSPSLLNANPIFNRIIEKSSPTVKNSSYLFVDLNEKNAANILSLAKEGQFPFILIYSSTWAKTIGTYQINPISYPNGLAGLMAVSNMAAQRDIKVGLHTLTALISKNDPLSYPLPDPRLYKKSGVLVEKYGSYLVDFDSTLKYSVAENIANVINHINAGMIYFDGGESSLVTNDPDYDVAELQIEVLKRIKKTILVEGSGNVPRLWPYLSRMVTDDYAVLAPVEYLDFYKIAQILPMYNNNLMPAQLGWIGLMAETPSSPATTVEDVSTYMARSLALGIPFSIETRQAYLQNNPYTARLFHAYGATNKVLQRKGLTATSKERLRTDRWYFVDGKIPYFAQLDQKQIHVSAELSTTNLGVIPEDVSGVMLRIKGAVDVDQDSERSISLLPNKLVAEKLIVTKDVTDSNRGLLLDTIELNDDSTNSSAITKVENLLSGFVGFKKKTLDLSSAKKMYVEYKDELNKQKPLCSVLNLQLEDEQGLFRDYFLDFGQSEKNTTIVRYEDAPSRMLRELRPAYRSYPLKSALRFFDFSKVVALNLRLMKSCDTEEKIILEKVAMLKERPIALEDIVLMVGGEKVLVIPRLYESEVLDIFPDGTLSFCKLGVCKTSTVKLPTIEGLKNKNLSISTKRGATYDIDFGILRSKILIGK